MIEFDVRLGTPGLHDVGRSTDARERPIILCRPTSSSATRRTPFGKT